MIARAIEQRPPGVVRQVAQQEDVVLERLQRLQNARQLAELALRSRIPVAMMMPFGTYTNAIRTGVLAGAAKAGAMESRKGRATAVPMPRKMVRRAMALRWTNINRPPETCCLQEYHNL